MAIAPIEIRRAPGVQHAGLRLWVVGQFLVATGALGGCQAPQDVGRKELIVGTFLGETEIARVADLMARDLVREPVFYGGGRAPRVAFVKVENDTNQYFFPSAQQAYLTRMRTQLARALGDRVFFVAPETEVNLQGELRDWWRDEPESAARLSRATSRADVDYLLTASFGSLNKTVKIPDEKGIPANREIVELLMVFSMVDARTGELAWQHSLSTAADFTTRDFQN